MDLYVIICVLAWVFPVMTFGVVFFFPLHRRFGKRPLTDNSKTILLRVGGWSVTLAILAQAYLAHASS